MKMMISIFSRFKIWICLLKSFILAFPGTKAHILDADKTINELNDNNRSLIRLGDGEFGIYNKRNIHYQKWSPELKEAFDKIKLEYELQGDNCRYLLAIPRIFLKCNGFFLLRKRVYISSWVQVRYDFKKYFNKDLKYGDAFLFEKANMEIYPRIWNDNKAIVFIHNNEKYADHFKKTYNKNVYFIECPSKNAFEQIEKLENKIKSCMSQNKLTAENTDILISAGPAGKVLVYKLSEIGIRCIDTGHCWDDPLEIT